MFLLMQYFVDIRCMYEYDHIFWIDDAMPYKVQVMKDKSQQESERIEGDQSKDKNQRDGCGSKQ